MIDYFIMLVLMRYTVVWDSGLFTESTAYDLNSPYSASKASSDHFVRAYGETYNMPYVITNCSNNYGAFSFQKITTTIYK